MGHIPRVTEGSLARATSASPTHQRCLIENCSHLRGVQLAHLLPRRLSGDDRLMSCLEWSWKMRRGTLNLDTRQNIMFVGASLRLMLDKGQWGLLPEDYILDEFLSGGYLHMREKFPDYGNTTFKYTFIPIEDMEDVWLTRQNEHPLKPAHLQNHVYPFHTLPTLTSHVHPKFAVFMLGYWLNAVRRESRGAVLAQWPSVHKVVKLWGRWTQQVPLEAASDPTYVDPNTELLTKNEEEDEGGMAIDDRESDGDSVSTRPRRIPYPPPKRRRRPPLPVLASPAPQNESSSHDEEPITPIDQDGSCWSQDQISAWARSCSTPTSSEGDPDSKVE
ncbi:hypothetical protein BKA70DRAFT_1431073 [Coprinopsis sp. MPI-PUGE-AT-0042]|nr:hypothetical protein BKA70DRAFT_1431073 [Coprinopsis sp. MPI-PUGE-AT-0042]